MNCKRIFSLSKYDFLKDHASCILEMILGDAEEYADFHQLNQEFLLSLLDYLTISKYRDSFEEYGPVILYQQIEFEESIELVETNLKFKEKKNPYEEVERILRILKINLNALLNGGREEYDNERTRNTLDALAMYEEFNLEKKQSKEVTYGKHHK